MCIRNVWESVRYGYTLCALKSKRRHILLYLLDSPQFCPCFSLVFSLVKWSAVHYTDTTAKHLSGHCILNISWRKLSSISTFIISTVLQFTIIGHLNSEIRYLSPVPWLSGTVLCPLIPVPDWFRHWHICSFRIRTITGCPTVRHFGILKCWRWKGIHPRVHNAGGGKELHV